jgi:hypothetical protein
MVDCRPRNTPRPSFAIDTQVIPEKGAQLAQIAAEEGATCAWFRMLHFFFETL